MLKMMSVSSEVSSSKSKSQSTNNDATTTATSLNAIDDDDADNDDDDEYSPPWEHKESLLFKNINSTTKSSTASSQHPTLPPLPPLPLQPPPSINTATGILFLILDSEHGVFMGFLQYD